MVRGFYFQLFSVGFPETPLIKKKNTSKGTEKKMTRFIDKRRSRPVAQIGADKDIRIFQSITEANCHTRVSVSSICMTCQGKQNQAGGYKWKYADELTDEERTYVRETPEKSMGMEIR